MFLRIWSAGFACSFIAGFLIAAAPVLASAVIVVQVVDGSGARLAGATIQQVSDEKKLGVTDASGMLSVSALPGTLLIAVFRGQRSTGTPLLSMGTQIRILQTIGVVKQSAVGVPPAIRRTSVESLLSSSLAGALRFDPQYRSAAEGGSDREEINGVPLPLPPSGGGIGGARYSTELFESYNPNDANGSTIPNFHLVAPTQNTEESADLTYGRFDHVGLRGTLSGRAKRLGFGFSALAEGDEGDLAHLVFRDISGKVYDHSQGYRSQGATSNLFYDLGATQLAVSGIAEQRYGRDISNLLIGPIPQGFGSSASQHSHDATDFLTVDHAAGRDHLFYVGVAFIGGGDVDHGSATLLLHPANFFTAYRYHGTYQRLKISRLSGVSTLYLDTVQQTFSLDNGGAVGSSAGSSASITTHIGIDTTTKNASYGAKVGVSNISGSLVGNLADASVHIDYHRPSFMAHAGFSAAPSQNDESASASNQVFGPPSAASIDCAGNHAVVNAPGAIGSAHPNKIMVDMNMRFKPDAALEVSAGGFVSAEHNALVSGFAEQNLGLDAAYIAKVSDVYAATCGSLVPLPASRIFGQRFSQANALLSQEGFLAAKVRRGRFSGAAFIELLSRHIADGPSPLHSTSTTLIPNQQLPFVPLQRANLMVSYDSPRIVAALDALFTSVNNTQNLPGHIELFVGLGYNAPTGFLSLSVENPLNAYSGSFISSRYAVPLASSKGPFSALAKPISSVWTLKYQFSVNSHKPKE